MPNLVNDVLAGIDIPLSVSMPKYNRPHRADVREARKETEKPERRILSYEEKIEKVNQCGRHTTRHAANGSLIHEKHMCNYIHLCPQCRADSMKSLMMDYQEAISDIGGQLYVFGIALPNDEWHKIRGRLSRAGLMYAKINVSADEYYIAVASVGIPQVYKMTNWIDVEVNKWDWDTDVADLWYEMLTYSEHGKKTGQLVNYRESKKREEDKLRVSKNAEVGVFFFEDDTDREDVQSAHEMAVQDTQYMVWYANECLDGLIDALEKRTQSFMERLRELGVQYRMYWKEIKVFEDELGDFK